MLLMLQSFRLFLFLQFFSAGLLAQSGSIVGSVVGEDGEGIPMATIAIEATKGGVLADVEGKFKITGLDAGTYSLKVSALGYESKEAKVLLEDGQSTYVYVQVAASAATLDQVVVTGTMKAVSRANSPVPVEVYTAEFFRANPAPSVFESLQNVNGVRPQLNCAVCNTGDIHINGLEGPYTMVLIDGMPIVSGLSTVYGLTGIPQSMIARTEVVKGPASSLYGSEAVGGVINVITLDPEDAPVVAADVMASGWGEVNTDLGLRARVGKRANTMLGINYFNYQQPKDKNGDGFTDVTLQDRISVFNKWSFNRKDGKLFTLAGRYVYEDRFGGELN